MQSLEDDYIFHRDFSLRGSVMMRENVHARVEFPQTKSLNTITAVGL